MASLYSHGAAPNRKFITPSEAEALATGDAVAIDAAVARVASALRAELLAEQRALLAALVKARALAGGGAW